MRYLIFLSALFWGSLLQGTAQTARIDSLRNLLNASESNEQVDVLNEYSAAIFSYDYKQSEVYSLKAYRLAEKLKYKAGLAKALINQGIIQNSIGNDSLAIKDFRRSLLLSKEIHHRHIEGNARVYIGQLFQQRQRQDSTLIYYQQAFELLKDSLNPLYLSYLYLNMARYYQVINQDSMRISYLLKSWHIRERLKEKRPFVWIGIQISNYIEHANYKQSSYYLERIKTALGKDTVNNEEISIIYKQQAIILAKEGNYKGSLSLFSIVRKFYGRNVFPYDLCNLYNEIGLVLWDLSNFETSLKYYLKALKIAKANHYEKELVQVSNNIGWIYLELNQLSLAQEYSKDALEKAIANRFSFEEAAAYNLLGLVEEKYGNYQQALDYFKKSLAIRKANKFLDKEASTLNNMSNLYALMSDLVKSEATGLQSLKINNEIKNLLGQCESHQVLGQVYVSRNNFTKALNHLNEAEALATRMKLNDILVKVYDSKRELYRKQSDMVNAYYYLGLMQVVHDSLFNQNLGNRIATMKYDFELDQRDNEIKILSQDRELQERKLELQKTQINQQRWVIIIGLIILILVVAAAAVVYRFYIRVIKLNKEVAEQKEEIQVQAEELQESNQTVLRINESLENKIDERTHELKEAYRELDTFFYRSSHDFRRPLTTFMGLAEVAKVTVNDPIALDLFKKVNDTARSLDKMLAKLQSISIIGVAGVNF